MLFRWCFGNIYIAKFMPPLVSYTKLVKILTTPRFYSTVIHPPDDEDEVTTTLLAGLTKGNRSSLSKAITLIESTRLDHKKQSQRLLHKVMAMMNEQKSSKNTFRIGITGPPGAGKSTFIESFGNFLIDQGNRVAVLAVDPSSQRTGGSLMGDKTRMPSLSVNTSAFIRPSPSGGSLGGVASRTKESIVLCEGAGFNLIIVETMGVGQSEVAVSEMVDLFCLILTPAGGDELQGLKRGIMEMADLVLVNKCDGDLIPVGRKVAMDYTSALKFIKPRHEDWKVKVLQISSKEGTGLEKVWQLISQFKYLQETNGELLARRKQQDKLCLTLRLQEGVMDGFFKNIKVKDKLDELSKDVEKGVLPSGMAAEILLKVFYESKNDQS